MTSHSGYVQYLKIDSGANAFASIGPTAQEASLLVISLSVSDTPAKREMKRALIGLLSKACAYGLMVEATTQVEPRVTIIVGLSVGPLEVAPNDQPVHNDFYAVAGQGFPDDAKLQFDSDAATVTVTPDLVRPHLLFVASLSDLVPIGRNSLTVISSAGTSAAIDVEVSDEPLYLKRVFCSGAPKQYPFTLALVANGAIDRDGSLDLYADTVLGNRAGYHAIAAYAMGNIFAVDEDFLRRDGRDAEMRIFSVFDAGLTVAEANTLCEEDPDTTAMFAKRERVKAFLANYGETTDLCIAFHNSPTNTLATANRCLDDYNRGSAEAFELDGAVLDHWPFRDEPGSTAISINNLTSKMTAIHELGHALSEDNNGRVRDLYNNSTYTEPTVNKRWRSLNTDPIPADFATYKGASFNSDQTRDSLGYPTRWVTYHCQLRNGAVPNIMDAYAPTSKFDTLTYAWYADRVRVILDR
jgi:hypothetical protein